MMKLKYFLATCLFWALAVGTANAQNKKGSHLPIEGWGGGSDFAKARAIEDGIRNKLGQPQSTPEIPEELVKRFVEMFKDKSPEQLKDIQQKLEQDPQLREQFRRIPENNPKLREQIEREFKNKPALGGNRDRAEEVKEMVNRFKQNEQRNNGDKPPRFNPSNNSTVPQSNPMTPRPQSPMDSNTPPVNRPTFDPRLRPAGSRDDAGAERFKEFVRRLDRNLPESMKDSEAVKNLTRKLADRDWGKGSSKFFDKLRSKIDLGDRLKGSGNFLERSFNRMSGRRMPSMPNISAPNLPSAPRAPSFGAPGAPSGAEMGGAFTVLLVIAVVLIGGFMIWKLLVQPARARAPRPAAWDPGSWPVDPSQVRTREELIRAFDHLALLRGGPSARHWHHDQVAERLVTDESQRAIAIRVADVYELARYSPPQEPLATERVASAGIDIRSLAGQS